MGSRSGAYLSIRVCRGVESWPVLANGGVIMALAALAQGDGMSKVGQPCFSFRVSWTGFVLLVLLCKVSAPGVASREVCDPILEYQADTVIQLKVQEPSGIFL